MSEIVRGYKVFNKDWTCKYKRYACPGRFKEENISLQLCEKGMHFCLDIKDCFTYYEFDPNNHVAEVIAHGKVMQGADKCCTDDLEIVHEIPWDEVLRMVNTGKDCTGFGNTGNCNTGNCNTGNRNTGNWNTGNCNTGNCNTGNRNTGNCNTGDRNTGDWNESSFNTGCFMTEEPKISLFNKPSDWSYMDWQNSEARLLLNQIPKNVVEWIYSEDMTEEEKTENPTHETTGGYLKVLDESECAQFWWDGLRNGQKEIIMNIPNFNREIFEKVTGIKIETEIENGKE